jgi:lysozyme
MWKNTRTAAAVALWCAASFATAQPSAEPEWVDLVDDQSRSQLAAYEMLKYAPPGQKLVRRAFYFPENANDGIYGVDVSHHNGQLEWPKIAGAGVKFVYIKAGQGTNFRDPRFSVNWRAAAGAGLVRGAYHFLAAGQDGAQQARSYLALVAKAGGFAAGDLAPVLDIEWDFVKVGTVKVDLWSNVPADQIAKAAKDWLETVHAATGRRPLIYTSASWWNERMAGTMLLKDYPHWIADYRQSSINAGAPKSVKQHVYLAWQFTDVGSIDGAGVKFDVNRVKGKDLGVLSGNQP